MSLLDVVSYLSPELGDIVAIVLAVVLILNVVSGLMYCFFGYKIYRLVIMIQGFLGGAVVGAIIGLFTRSAIGIFVCAFCIGALGAFLSWYLFYIGVFLQAFWTGMLISMVAMLGMGGFDPAIISAAVMAGIFLGVLACILIKVAIVFLTAFSGALTVGGTVGAMGGLDFSMTIILCVVLFTLGFLFQMYMCRRRKRAAAGASQELSAEAAVPGFSRFASVGTGIVGAIIVFFLTGVWKGFPSYYFHEPVWLAPVRILTDISICAGGYGIGYFIVKKVNEKNEEYPLDFSFSNNAVICGLGGAAISLIARVLRIVSNYGSFIGYPAALAVAMLHYTALLTCLGGFTLGYLIYSFINRKPVPKAVRPAASATQTRTAAKPEAVVQTANPVPEPQAGVQTAAAFSGRAQLFAPNIDNELNYVFPEDILYMMKTMPVINDDGSWICSCGRLCREEYCNVCGMAKEDIRTKFTYQYLKKHREERLAREAEEERSRQAE